MAGTEQGGGAGGAGGAGGGDERRTELRAADADRQVVADRLRSALDEGRLTLSEYDERLQHAYASLTYGELERVVADLPGHHQYQTVVPVRPASPSGMPVVSGTPSPRRAMPTWLVAVWGAWLTAVLVNVAIWAAIVLSTGEFIYFWPIWVAGPWGAVLLARTVIGLATGNDPQAEKDAAKRAEDAEKQAQKDAERRARGQAH